MKKPLAFITIIAFLSLNVPAFGYTQVPAFLCELGIQYYNQGNYKAALHEFNKALLAQPGYPPALEYIHKIKQEKEATIPKKRLMAIEELMDQAEKERRFVPAPPVIVRPSPLEPTKIPPKEVLPIPVLTLDENIKSLIQPIEIEQGKSLIIAGRNITRFLVTSPDVISIEKKSPNEILLTGNQIGYTDIHIWDQQGRQSFEFLTVPPKPEGPTLEELMLLEEEHADTFKLRYYMDWNSFEEGRRINLLNRKSYGYSHWISLDGMTPYGIFDSGLSVRSLRKTTDLTYVRLGLTEGRFGPFKDFTLRGLDYTPPFSNLIFSSAALRGAMLESPAFNEKIDYTVFWGREGGGRFGNLSPGLAKIKNSFLSGFDLDFNPTQKQDYGFTVIHGWGRQRPDDLNAYNYDLYADWNLDKWDLRYEIAHDSETFAHLFNSAYTQPNLRLTAEIRNTDKQFRTATAWGYRIGELGGLFTLAATPTKKLNIFSRLDVFQDRLFPSLEDNDRWNEDFNCNLNYIIDPLTSLRLDYLLQNELGRVGESRYQSPGIGLNRTFELFRKIYTFANYRHQENKNYSAPTVDYINEKIFLGLRFPLIGDLYYYLNREFNWLEERFSGNHFQPQALETGFDWTGQILNGPFYGNLRCLYRDEEDTASNLSFLSGEDYIEAYGELSYRPVPGKELYCSTRIRNIWAENPNITKRIEADLRAGMRYLWDTGIRWESVGTVDGYVFKDYNSDGLRQRDEPPVEGIKIWLGKDKSVATDIFGYYKFTKVKAKRAFLNIDTAAIPAGFILTVPATQEITISHGQIASINFGIVSRSEIIGTVFEDRDLDGQLGMKDSGVAGVVLVLEDGTKIITDSSGRYFLRNISTGTHTINLDLNSLPAKYIPTVPIFKDIELTEGISYSYNIPLKKIE